MAESLTLEETRRRVFALCAYRCPDHGCDLEECHEPDGDETGVWTTTYYRCLVGGEHFPCAGNDPSGGPWPSDREEMLDRYAEVPW